MEIINQVWVWIASAVGGISLTSIITAIIYGCLKSAFNKTISKINVQKIADQATEKGVEKVKKISFTHSIQPLVESELKKVNEHSIEVLKIILKKIMINIWLFGNNVVSLQSEILSMPYRRKISGS